MWCGVLCGCCVSPASYAVVPLIFPGLSAKILFIIACVVTAITLFVMGAIKVRHSLLPLLDFYMVTTYLALGNPVR